MASNRTSSPRPRRSIDWSEIRRRVDAFGAALESGAGRNGADARQILRARAEALAQKPASAGLETEQVELLEFRVGPERWAVELGLVREVEFLRNLTPIPCTPIHVLGVIQLRGRIVAVNDLRQLFKILVDVETPRPKVIVLSKDECELAVLVDTVDGTTTIARNKISAPPATLGAAKHHYLLGVTPDAIAVLDGHRLLHEKALRVNERLDE